MGDAYTPGLTVTPHAVVRKTRRLPLTGGVVVDVGQRVAASDVVARTDLPGKVHLINFANVLGVLPTELDDALLVKEGDKIEKGQMLGEHRAFFGLSRAQVKSPIDGSLESVSRVTGQAVLREPPQPVEVTAYIDGVVVEEIPHEGVVVETKAALVQGIFGLAGEVNAPLVVLTDEPGGTLQASEIDPSHEGKIVVHGGRATLEAMRHAIELGVGGVVCGGFAYQDIKEILGYDVGVAVTGNEPLATTLVVTEGFGDIAMARATLELLARHNGEIASINGATQIRAGVIRPEVVIPLAPDAVRASDEDHVSGLEIGSPVRCIRAPYFGQIGVVTGLPVDLVQMPSETMVRICEVELDDGTAVTVPRANVEVIEH
jgi:hypothetical protein